MYHWQSGACLFFLYSFPHPLFRKKKVMRVTSTYWSNTVISVSWQWNNLNNSISIQTLYYLLLLHQYQWSGRQTTEFGLYFMSYSFFSAFFFVLFFFKITSYSRFITHLETSYFEFISKFLLICISYSYKNFIDLIFYFYAF